MKPIFWLYLYIFFSLFIIIYCLMIFFITNYKNHFININNLKKNNSWKW